MASRFSALMSLSTLALVLLVGVRRCYGGDCSVNKFDKSCIDPKLVASYDEIVDLPNHPEKLLVDVRNPEELAATGVIPTSINIPRKFQNTLFID